MCKKTSGIIILAYPKNETHTPMLCQQKQDSYIILYIFSSNILILHSTAVKCMHVMCIISIEPV